MKEKKTSIRYFLGSSVRAVWDERESEWFYSATDVVAVLSRSSDPRRYWNNLKHRNPRFNNVCSQKIFVF